MPTFKLSINLSLAGPQPVEACLPVARRALEMVGKEAQARWKNMIETSDKIHDRWKGDYINSIIVEMAAPLQVSVYSEWEYAYEIENGRPSRDLKRMLDTSMKVRVSTSKKNAGKRYLIIPFRHTLKSMPAAVQSAAKMLTKSQVTGMGLRVSGQVRNDLKGRWGTVAQDRERRGAGVSPHSGFLVSQRKYLWGGRLPDGLALKEASHHKTDRFAGMVRMNASSGKSRSSVYLTFRTMMEGSPGWVTKPVPGVFQMPELAREIEPFAQSSITEALRKMPAMS